MVLHRPVELARLIGHVVLGRFHLSGFGVNQALAGRLPSILVLGSHLLTLFSVASALQILSGLP
jgi:hypothetical protein